MYVFVGNSDSEVENVVERARLSQKFSFLI